MLYSLKRMFVLYSLAEFCFGSYTYLAHNFAIHRFHIRLVLRNILNSKITLKLPTGEN